VSDDALTVVSDAKRAVVRAHTITDCNKLVKMAQAIQVVADTEEMRRKAGELYLRARRRRGEIERELPKQDGGDAMRARSEVPTEVPATLAEQGIDKRDASVDYKLLDIPVQAFEDYLTTAEDITTAGALRAGKKAAPRTVPEAPPGLYRVVYADPPWWYDSMQHGKKAQDTTLDTHYPQLPTEEIAAIGVDEKTPERAVLFLWVTSPKLYEAETVFRAWGFTYKTSIIWDKVRHNVGYYVSVRHEFLLICTKGSCLPDATTLEDSVVSIERDEHSAKPACFRDWIDRMYLPPETGRDRIEMFPRGALPDHWERWGHGTA